MLPGTCLHVCLFVWCGCVSLCLYVCMWGVCQDMQQRAGSRGMPGQWSQDHSTPSAPLTKS